MLLFFSLTANAQYSGGRGTGYGVSENIGTSCFTIEIFKGDTSDGFSYIADSSICIMPFAYRGGSGNGFSFDTTLKGCNDSSSFIGSAGDGLDFLTDFGSCVPIFSTGGGGAGFSFDTILNHCNQTVVYKGDSGDGAHLVNNINACVPKFFTIGGAGNGFSVDTALNNCTRDVIYAGVDSGDGFHYMLQTPCPIDSIEIFAEVLQNINCGTGDSGIAFVRSVNVGAGFSSPGPYTLTWYNDALIPLAGYPIVSGSPSDTLYNLPSGLYYVSVEDNNGKADTAQIYINGCLYRGGIGSGNAVADSVVNCQPQTVALGDTNDGFASGSDFSSCIGIYSTGGHGQGFSIDSVQNACTPFNYAVGTSDDGHSAVIDIKTCENDLFTVGGGGQGFAYDTVLTNCNQPDVIYTGNQDDGFSYNNNINSCGSLFTSGGSGNGFATLQHTDTCASFVDVYTGGNGDGHGAEEEDLFCYIVMYNVGGPGAGFSTSAQQQTCIDSSYTTGTQGDGFTFVQAAATSCQSMFSLGGNGNGFTMDTIQNICNDNGVYFATQGDGFSFTNSEESCIPVFSSGGPGNGFSRDTTLRNCNQDVVFTGDQGDGFDFETRLETCVPIYSVGGFGNGFSTDSANQTCTLQSLATGTNNDGFSFASHIASCVPMYSIGGAGHGFYFDTLTQNCSGSLMYAGDQGDGSDASLQSPCPRDTIFVNAQVIEQTNCLTGDSATVLVSVVQQPGADFYTEPPFTYEIYSEGWALFTGFPKASAQYSDTVFNMPTGGYHALVTDNNGKIDTADFYVNGCLYRGGFGGGYTLVDTIQDCQPTNFAIGDTNDGFAYGLDAPICPSNMFTVGGVGNGFASDSINENCTLEPMYTATQGDGFSFLFDSVECNNSMYSLGGFGNGFSYDTVLSACSPLVINTGNISDGFAYDTGISNCPNSLFTSGGSGHGFNTNSAQYICTAVLVISTGNIADGFAYNIDSSSCAGNNKLFTGGGYGNGYASEATLETCANDNVYVNTQQRGDGHSHLYDDCTVFIYDNSTTTNNCLQADTIVSTGSGEWQDILLDGDLVASIRDNGNILDTITTEFYVNDGPVRDDPFNIFPDFYLDRNFHINVTGDFIIWPPRDADVRLYFTENEWTKLQGADVSVNFISDLGVVKYHGYNQNCQLADNKPTNPFPKVYTQFVDVLGIPYENGYYLEFSTPSFSEFYISTKNYVLPMVLLNFTAQLNDDQTLLRWVTVSEKNTDYFVVQRTRDGITFEDIIVQEAAGNSNNQIVYDDIDENPLFGRSYYRLKQVDFDGTAHYSDLVEINYSPDNPTMLLYPNPTNIGLVNVKITGLMQTKNGVIQLVDMLGRIVEEVPVTLTTGTNDEQIQFNVAQGIYLVRVKARNLKLPVQKLIVR